MNKKQTSVIAGLMMVAMLTSSVTYGNAFAQEVDVVATDVAPIQSKTILAGQGAIVRDDGTIARSHFMLKIHTSDANETDLEVVKGKFVLKGDNHRNVVKVVPDTWTVSVLDDDSVTAFGSVESSNGVTYEVSLSGEFLRDFNRGDIYFVEGTAVSEEDGTEFDLYYTSAMFDKRPLIKPLSPNIRG